MAGLSLQVVEAFRRCTVLRELEFGLYAHSPRPGHGCSDATSLFRRILDVLPDSRLDRLAFVLDLGGSWERMGYLDRRFWCSRLPTMKDKMLVQDRARGDRLSVEQYVAPMGIDLQRDARLAAPGLRSLFDL